MKRNQLIILGGIVSILGIAYFKSVLFSPDILSESFSSMANVIDTPMNRVIAVVSAVVCLLYVLCCFIARE